MDYLEQNKDIIQSQKTRLKVIFIDNDPELAP